MEATRGEVTGHAMELEEELEHTKRVQGETADRLVSRSADVESVTRSLVRVRAIYEKSALPAEGIFLSIKTISFHGSTSLELLGVSLCQLINCK